MEKDIMEEIYVAAIKTDPKLWEKIPKEDLDEDMLDDLLVEAIRAGASISLNELKGILNLKDGDYNATVYIWAKRKNHYDLEELKFLRKFLDEDEFKELKNRLVIDSDVSIETVNVLKLSPFEILCMGVHDIKWEEFLAPLITEEEKIEIALDHDYHILRYSSSYVGMEVVKQCDKSWLKKVIQEICHDNRTNEMLEIAFKRSPSLIIGVNDKRLNMNVAKMVIEEGDFSEEGTEERTKIMEKLIPFMDGNLIRIAFDKKLLTRELLREHTSLAKIVGEFDAETAVEVLPSSEWNRDAKELANRKKQELVKKLIKDYDEYREEYDGNVGWILEDFVEAYKKYC